MSGGEFTVAESLGCAGAAFGFWLLVPLPFWVLSSGFGGGFYVPNFGVGGQGDVLIAVVFSALFYAPLLIIALFLREARRGRPSGLHRETDA